MPRSRAWIFCARIRLLAKTDRRHSASEEQRAGEEGDWLGPAGRDPPPPYKGGAECWDRPEALFNNRLLGSRGQTGAEGKPQQGLRWEAGWTLGQARVTTFCGEGWQKAVTKVESRRHQPAAPRGEGKAPGVGPPTQRTCLHPHLTPPAVSVSWQAHQLLGIPAQSHKNWGGGELSGEGLLKGPSCLSCPFLHPVPADLMVGQAQPRQGRGSSPSFDS